jgi:threonine dehydrogenase-like Zn-dependent dehydrogenase
MSEMKAVVFRGLGDIRLEDVADPRIQEPADAIVRITASAICGTDLHMVRGTIPGMKPGTILGHEGVGVVAEVGPDVRNLVIGDRVIIPTTIACGYCSYCRAGYYAQCDNANPGGPLAGTAYYGGPAGAGGYSGLQAELARIPYAAANLVKIPRTVSDDQALLLSDMLPTAYFGAEMAHIKPGRTVAVFGCGPVGQFVIACALYMGAGRVFAVDAIDSRLDMAREQGAEAVNFSREDPVETIRTLTGGIGVDCAIDAVGVDAYSAQGGPAAEKANARAKDFAEAARKIAPRTAAKDGQENDHWQPGAAPSQALEWAVQALAKAGTLSIIGVYPQTDQSFPIGMAMNKNLTVRMGNCNHRRYIPHLLHLVESGIMDPARILTQLEPMTSAVAAYEAFDRRRAGWMKVELMPMNDIAPGDKTESRQERPPEVEANESSA